MQYNVVFTCSVQVQVRHTIIHLVEQHCLQIGKSLFDEPGSQIVPRVMEKAKAKNVQFHLPVDFITGDDFKDTANVGSATVAQGIPDGWMVGLLYGGMHACPIWWCFV